MMECDSLRLGSAATLCLVVVHFVVVLMVVVRVITWNRFRWPDVDHFTNFDNPNPCPKRAAQSERPMATGQAQPLQPAMGTTNVVEM